MVLMRAWALALVLCLLGNAASAETTTPSQSASASPAPAPIWQNPPNTNRSIFDPCGGPKELLNKFGPTPCVYIIGEGMVSAGYANINTHGNLQITGNGPLHQTGSLPISGNANVFPQLLMAFGVSPSSQLQITLPSEVQVNSQRFGTFYSESNPSVDYKQRLFFSPKTFTQLAIDLAYVAPTNGGGINPATPTYQIQLDLAQPLNANFSIGPWWTFKNATTTDLMQTTTRGWSDPLGVYIVWSPAASTFELLPVVYHNFNPNRTAVLLEAVQLLSRHLSIALTYGGAQSSAQSNGPFFQLFNFATSTTPRVFTVNFYYLANESNLPPQPPPAPATTAMP